MTIHIAIGNSDDHLSQSRWHDYVGDTERAIDRHSEAFVGRWCSEATSQYQNACWGVEVTNAHKEPLRKALRRLAAEYGQDSIAWNESQTEFLTP